MKISVAESNPDVGLSLTQRTFPLSPDVLATDRHNQMPIMTMSIVSLLLCLKEFSLPASIDPVTTGCALHPQIRVNTVNPTVVLTKMGSLVKDGREELQARTPLQRFAGVSMCVCLSACLYVCLSMSVCEWVGGCKFLSV